MDEGMIRTQKHRKWARAKTQRDDETGVSEKMDNEKHKSRGVRGSSKR